MAGLQSRAHAALGVVCAAALAGCASLSPDGGFSAVEQTVGAHHKQDVIWARNAEQQRRIDDRVAALLQQPLSADAAVQLALLNNKALQAQYFALGIGEAELVQAASLPNPGFSFARLTRGSEVELERSFHFNLARLIVLPALRDVEAKRFARIQGAVASGVLTLAADTRKAWVQAVAAEASMRYGMQVMQAAEASAELARRMAQVGNFSKLQRAREQAFYADAALGVARAQALQHQTRERLTRLLGLWGDAATSFKLPERLPDLPAAPNERPDIERSAIAQRLDVQSARIAAAETAQALDLTRTTRFINVLELGLEHNSSNQEPTQRGWEVTLELPLFDWGTARSARAESVYMQSLQRAAATAINARSEVREAWGNYRSAWDIARHHRDEIVPLRQRIAEENVLRYNGMLIGVFELLADARAQIAGVNAAIDALRDFWLAQADLETALLGKPSLAAATAASSMPAAESVGAGH